MKKNRANSKGFTLIETAIVLVIGSILLTMLFDSLNTYMKNFRLSTTRERLETINTQIGLYLEDNGYLPCPARRTLAADDANYGISLPNCITGDHPRVFTSGLVRIGMVPTRTLNIPDDMAYDAWGNRIVYAVTAAQATEDNYTNNGGRITIRDGGGADITTVAHFILVAPGPNKNGAFNISGGNANCIAGTLDTENCNNDHIFTRTILASDSGNAYDDVVLYQSQTDFDLNIPRGSTILMDQSISAGCPPKWDDLGAATTPANHRYCRKP